MPMHRSRSFLKPKGGATLLRDTPSEDTAPTTVSPQPTGGAGSSSTAVGGKQAYRCCSTSNLGVYDIETTAAKKNLFHQGLGKKVYPGGFEPLAGEDRSVGATQRTKFLSPLERYHKRAAETRGDRSTLVNEWEVRTALEAEFTAAKKKEALGEYKRFLTPQPTPLAGGTEGGNGSSSSSSSSAPPPRAISVLTEQKLAARVNELLRAGHEGLRRHQQIMQAVHRIPLWAA